MKKRRAGALTEVNRADADRAHAAGISALTRLRVIAGTDVVRCAEELHMADDTGSDMVLSTTELPSEEDWRRTVARRRELRNRFLAAASALTRPLLPRPAQPSGGEVGHLGGLGRRPTRATPSST